MPEEVAVIAIVAILSWATISIVRLFVNRNAVVKPAELREIDDRLLRIEQAVDAIAIEMERVAEGQRFATKVLADRAGATLPSGSGGPGSRDRASS